MRKRGYYLSRERKKRKRYRIVFGNILDTKMEVIVVPTSRQPVIYSEILSQLIYRYPDLLDVFLDLAQNYRLHRPYLHQFDSKHILFFPTRTIARTPANLNVINRNLLYVANNYKNWGIKSMAFPALGCGSGGLLWKDIKPMLIHYLKQLEIFTEIYRPWTRYKMLKYNLVKEGY